MKKAILATILLGMFSSLSVSASEEVNLRNTYNASDLKVLSITNGVGSIRVEVADISSIEVEVAVEPTTSYFFFESDISDAELSASTNGGELALEVPVDDSEQNWLVRIPKHLGLSIDLGVGDVDISNINQNVIANVGVGEFSATLNQNSFKSLDAQAGVGGVSLSGFTNSENESHLVGNSTEIRGEGSAKLSVDVGVGGINLKNQRE
ncbi:MAG: hypothetical protein U5L01_10135 [Rheinheimera sp.]|nr:hypothetical protein [Rheinheimera sp.]